MNTRDIFRTLLSILCVANVCLLPACRDEDVAKRSKADRVPLHPVAERLADTRLDDTAWESGDQIGIYAYDSEGALADEVNSNVRYVINPENNGCTVANDDSTIWLQKGETYSVVAYYPFLKTFSSVDNPSVPTVLVQNVSTIVGGDKPGAEQQLATPMPIYIISNWADQSDLTVLDLLWCKEEGVSADDPDVTLSLAHQFCRVQLNITIDTELSSLTADSLAGMKVLLAGKNFPAFFDLHTGEMSFNSMLSDSIAFNIQRQEGATTAVASAIIVPDTENSNTEGRTITVQLPADNNRKYVIEIPDEIVFQSGKLYTWNITFNTGADLSTNSFYVSATGNNDNEGKRNSPLASFEGAVAKMNDPDADYTIYVDGTLTQYQNLYSALSPSVAQSVTIMGANGIDPETNAPKDSIKLSGSGASVLLVETDVPLTLSNIVLTGGNSNNNGGGILINHYQAKVTLADGAIITGNTAAENGGGIYMVDGASLYMTGGEISNNTVEDGSGGGIYANGNLTITGGTICRDTAKWGGGVYVPLFDDSYKVSIGGTTKISLNVADSCGGGICLDGYCGQPVMLSGSANVNRNISKKGGGIAVLEASMLIMSDDAVITDNNALNYGGGVYLEDDSDYGGAQLVMTGGTISTNSLIAGNSHGTGVYAQEGTAITMGGAARIASENDVYLDGEANNAKIYIGSLLTAEAPVATITPGDNVADLPTVLTVGQYYVDGDWVDATTTVAENFTKFAISGNTGIINQDGVYLAAINIDGVVSQITSMTASGTVTVDGYLPDGTSAFPRINGALKTLFENKSDIEVTLDMSNVTGLTELPSASGDETQSFCNCANLAGVILPQSLTKIGDYAFRKCSKLRSIDFPESLSYIGTCAFYDSGLQRVVVPNGVTEYGVQIFCGSSDLVSAVLGTGFTTVPDNIFWDCSSLASVELHGEIVGIGSEAFRGCRSLETFDIPATVTSIGELAFYQSGLTSVSIPDGVESIAQQTFFGCSSLQSVTLSEGLQTIGTQAFCSCGLNTVTIPGTVTTISGYAFMSCSGLESVVLSSGVREIGQYAFISCDALTTVYYTGTEADRDNMTIEDETITGSGVTWVYNYDPNGPTYYGSNAPGSTLSVGDIVFNDGSSMPYSSTMSLSDAQKAAAVAVIFDASAKKGCRSGADCFGLGYS